MHTFSNILLFFLVACFASAQSVPHKTRIGGFIGMGFDPSTLTDPGGRMDDTFADYIQGGLEVDVEYTDVFSFGSGLIFKNYAAVVDFGSNFPTWSDAQLFTLQIPVHLRARTLFARSMATAYATGGAALAINLNGESMTSIGTYTIGNTVIRETSTADPSLKKIFPLVFLGAGIDFPIHLFSGAVIVEKFRMGFSARRFFGFSDVLRVHTDYVVDNTLAFSAVQNLQGSYWMFNIHVKYILEH